MTILVTGAAGFIGFHLTRRLLADGHRVHGIDNLNNYYDPDLKRDVVLPDLTEDRIRTYIRQRHSEQVSGRTINMEIGELSRSIGHPWSLLWPRVRKLEEPKDVGRALSPGEQAKLLSSLDQLRTPHLETLIPVLLLTGMRSGEAKSLTWRQVDLLENTITGSGEDIEWHGAHNSHQ